MPAWSGLWNGVYGATHSLIGSPSQGKRLGRALRGVNAKKYKEILRTFVTDDTGSAALATHTRLTTNTDGAQLGGVRQIETVVDVNRNVTANDKATLVSDIDSVHTPTFPKEKSGNSGGGKRGF